MRRISLLWALIFSVFLSGCQGSKDGDEGGASVASSEKQASDQFFSGSDLKPEKCVSDETNFFCLGLKYVIYLGKDSQPTVTEGQAARNVREVNRLWKQCRIAFQIDRYLPVVPEVHHLPYHTYRASDFDQIRATFEDDSTLLLVTTGDWDRNGALGYSWANAWTNMPEQTPYGVVMERSVGSSPEIIAHELGHYLNLDHLDDPADLMNPVIYPTSWRLDQNQCETARRAVQQYWARMIRQ